MHLAPSRNAEAVGIFGLVHAEGNVSEYLFKKPFAKLAGSNELTLPTRKGTVVYRESHFNGRLGYLNKRHRLVA